MSVKRLLVEDTEKREMIIDYLTQQGYEPEEQQILNFLNPSRYPKQHWEAVQEQYDIFDFDRWIHLMDLLGYEMSFKTAMTINSALWEEDIETIECQPIHEQRTALFKTIWDNNVERVAVCTVDIFTHEVIDMSVIDNRGLNTLLKEVIIYNNKEYEVYEESDPKLCNKNISDVTKNQVFWYKK